MTLTKPIRIAFLSIHPAPYRDPFLNRLACNPAVLLDVYTFLRQDQGHDFWNLPPPEYPNTYLPFSSFVPNFLRYQWSVLRLVLRSAHDVYVFPGFLMKASVTGMLLCVIMRKPYVCGADSVEDGPANKGILGLLKSLLIRRSAVVLVPGKAAEAYFHTRYSVPRYRICHGFYAMDTARIDRALANARADRAAIRRALGIADGETMFLMVANMTTERRYPTTAAGFLTMARRYADARFVMVGSGEDFNEMTALAKEHPALIVQQGCSFDEMLRLYGAADIYVHGGKEPASTALVIGALAKLPLLSSFAVGHCWDCLIDGVTGIVVADEKSSVSWATGFERIASSRDKWAAFGQAARDAACVLDVDRVADCFCKAVSDALHSNAEKPSG